jgi:hypothetical protein
LVKIGRTKNIQQRIKNLFSNYPDNGKLIAYYEVSDQTIVGSLIEAGTKHRISRFW